MNPHDLVPDYAKLAIDTQVSLLISIFLENSFIYYFFVNKYSFVHIFIYLNPMEFLALKRKKKMLVEFQSFSLKQKPASWLKC